MSPIMRLLILFLVMGAAILFREINDALKLLPAPVLPLDQWWGEGEAPKDWKSYVAKTSGIQNNRIIYPQSTIDDLRQQLNRSVHLPPPLEGSAFEYGFNSNYLRLLIAYWRDEYLPRWREREAFLWQFNHFTTDIQGLRMHFLHSSVDDEQKEGKQHYPILLLHGWPGSVREFYTLIHKLHGTQESDDNNKYVFSVVVPSLPGFGWSQGASRPGMGCAEIAVIMRNLMLRLGYQKFFVQGGDWGSMIGSHMATLFPENVLGYHSNLCSVISLRSQLKGSLAALFPSLFVPKGFESLFFPLTEKWLFLLEESGYFHLQATKPDTIGNALTANPVGLAVYILEKFSTWTNVEFRKLPDGGLTRRFELNALLDNLMIYILTNSITTSQRIYAESYSRSELALSLDRVSTNVPTGCARFKHDLMHFTDFQLRDKYRNLVHSTYYNEGGHFAALETPQLLYQDFIEFIKKVERQIKMRDE